MTADESGARGAQDPRGLVEPPRTFSPPIMPHQYEMLWELANFGPLAAGEFADARRYDSAQSTANKLRALVALELVERVDGIYHLTDRGRDWLEAPHA